MSDVRGNNELDILRLMIEYQKDNSSVQRQIATDIASIRAVLGEASVKFINIQEKVESLEEKVELIEQHVNTCPARMSHQAAQVSSKALNLWVSILVGFASLGSTITLVVMWLKSK